MGRYIEVLIQELGECIARLRFIQDTMDSMYNDFDESLLLKKVTSKKEIADVSTTISSAMSNLKRIANDIEKMEMLK